MRNLINHENKCQVRFNLFKNVFATKRVELGSPCKKMRLLPGFKYDIAIRESYFYGPNPAL